MKILLENCIKTSSGFEGKYLLDSPEEAEYAKILRDLDTLKEVTLETGSKVFKDLELYVFGEDHDQKGTYISTKVKLCNSLPDILDELFKNCDKNIKIALGELSHLDFPGHTGELEKIKELISGLSKVTKEEDIILKNIKQHVRLSLKVKFDHLEKEVEIRKKSVKFLDEKQVDINFRVKDDEIKTQVIQLDSKKINSNEQIFSHWHQSLTRALNDEVNERYEALDKFKEKFKGIIKSSFKDASSYKSIINVSEFVEALRVLEEAIERFKEESLANYYLLKQMRIGKFLYNEIFPDLYATRRQIDIKLDEIAQSAPVTLKSISVMTNLSVLEFLKLSPKEIIKKVITGDNETKKIPDNVYLSYSTLKRAHPEIAQKLSLAGETVISKNFPNGKHDHKVHAVIEKIENPKRDLSGNHKTHNIIALNNKILNNFEIGPLTKSFCDTFTKKEFELTTYFNPDIPELDGDKIIAVDYEIKVIQARSVKNTHVYS